MSSHPHKSDFKFTHATNDGCCCTLPHLTRQTCRTCFESLTAEIMELAFLDARIVGVLCAVGKFREENEHE